MAVERNWRITKIPDNGLPYAEAAVAKAALEDLADGRYLAPDHRLDVIADAWSEYKEFASQSGAMAVLREKMDGALTEETDDE